MKIESWPTNRLTSCRTTAAGLLKIIMCEHRVPELRSYRGPVGWGWSRGCSPGCEGSCCACPLAWWRPTPWREGSGRSCCGRAASPESWSDCRLSGERREANTCTVVRHHSEWMRRWPGSGSGPNFKGPIFWLFWMSTRAFSYFHSTRCCRDDVFFCRLAQLASLWFPRQKSCVGFSQFWVIAWLQRHRHQASYFTTVFTNFTVNKSIYKL